MTEFLELVQYQRAHRQFLDQPVDDATIEILLNAAIRAPSAENRQPWEFIVVRNPPIRQAIGEIMLRAWDGGAKQWSQTRLDASLLGNVDHGMRGGIANAPVLVVVCGNITRGMESTLGASIYPAVQNLLLAATELGLGSALTTLATHYQKELQVLLHLPPTVHAMAVIPIGYPAKQLDKSKRNAIETCTYRDRFGTLWYS
jgi:nitroreductase